MLTAHLSILGLSGSASAAELKAAYRREILKWHPDRFHSEPVRQPAATEQAKKINAAYEYLSELHERGFLPSSMPRANGKGPSRAQSRHSYRTQYTRRRSVFTPGFPDPNVFEVFVRSSHIVSAGYDRASQTLYIKFDGGVVHSYLDVPESVFTAFMAADSHGKFAHRNIYYQYESVRHPPRP